MLAQEIKTITSQGIRLVFKEIKYIPEQINELSKYRILESFDIDKFSNNYNSLRI